MLNCKYLKGDMRFYSRTSEKKTWVGKENMIYTYMRQDYVILQENEQIWNDHLKKSNQESERQKPWLLSYNEN